MADKKISQLTTLAQADVAPTADFLPIVDTGSVETKKVTPEALVLRTLGATTGNVGIGTASPAQRLDVVSSGAAVAQIRGGSGTNQGGSFFVRNAANTLTLFAAGDRATFFGGTPEQVYSIATGTSIPLTFDAGAAERMRLDSSGNLGIGTASPAARLDVVAADNSLQMRVGAATRGLEIKTFQAVGTNNAGVIYDAPVVGAGTHVFQTGSVERMRIDDDGNVSVGNGALATTATDGYLYVPTCAGVPTGTPTAKTGFAPIVVDTTNNRWYFYSGGAWRNAGP